MKNKKDIIRVIALVMIALILAGIMTMFTGCTPTNYQAVDTTWSFERAVIFLPDGEKIEGAVTRWKDFQESDMLQVTIDGKTYLTHSSNVILISE